MSRSQPIQLRFNELISGVRSDVAVKVFGDDMDVLKMRTAAKIATALKGIQGSSEVKVEQTTGLPVLTINIDREKAARYSLNIGAVQDAIAIAVGGRQAGTLYEGDRRFDMVVRLIRNTAYRRSGVVRLADSRACRMRHKGANQIGFIPLSQVLTWTCSWVRTRSAARTASVLVIVSANVRGRDLGSFVEEASSALATGVQIPAGYWTTWGGQFEQLQSAAKRLQIVVPVALLSGHDPAVPDVQQPEGWHAGLHRIPFALTGGVVALWLRDIPLSISAGSASLRCPV